MISKLWGKNYIDFEFITTLITNGRKYYLKFNKLENKALLFMDLERENRVCCYNELKFFYNSKGRYININNKRCYIVLC